MKFKLNRVAATGLIAAMLANATSCSIENFERLIPHLVNTTMTQTPPTSTSKFEGPIWDKLAKNEIMTITKLPYDDSRIEGYPVPLEFLMEKGIVVDKSKFGLSLSTERQATDMYRPFSSRAFVDKNSNENAIYLLFQFANGPIIPNETNADIYLMTWLLKYNVTEQDYQSFLNLDGDHRIRFFVQTMDEVYQPEVVSESIVSPLMLNLADYEDFGSKKNSFPYLFISNVDYNRSVVTFGAYDGKQLKFVNLDIRKTIAWRELLAQGYTEAELEKLIMLESMPTPFGPCLTEFNVNNWRAVISTNEAKELFKHSNDVIDVDDISINGTEAKYDLNDELDIELGF